MLTKLDSTAKGGIVFAIEHDLGVPVRFVGVGEQADDLLPFDPDALRRGAVRLSAVVCRPSGPENRTATVCARVFRRRDTLSARPAIG